ncbi:MAG: L-fucose mutarotase [Ruminococcaceae bacterium]|nr:L-fucose mutarotase [Oscillospiraceae bacterium]
MLKNVSPLISPQLLKVLCEMGHGDEIVLADANFPAESIAQNNQIIRADGLGIVDLLNAILPLFPLDPYTDKSFIVMSVEERDGDYVPEIWSEFEQVLEKHEPDFKMTFMSRFDYYEHSKKAYAVIATGEKATYANVILKKGVI